MELTKQMRAAEIRNWLADLAIGAKANIRRVRCADCTEEDAYQHTTFTYEQSSIIKDGVITVPIHCIKEVAKAAGLELQHRKLVKGNYCYDSFVSEDFFIFNGVKFTDYTLRKEKINDRK